LFFNMAKIAASGRLGLDGALDARLGAKVHPLAVALLDGADLILEAVHGKSPISTFMYAQ